MSEATESIEKDIRVMLDAIRTASQEGWFYDESDIKDQEWALKELQKRLHDEQAKETQR